MGVATITTGVGVGGVGLAAAVAVGGASLAQAKSVIARLSNAATAKMILNNICLLALP